MGKLRVVLIKPSKYDVNGYVQRYESGLMPNATLSHIASLTPDEISGSQIELEYIDEYVRTDLSYLDSLKARDGEITLVAVVGVQSHQFHRAIDLAAFAKSHGVRNIIVGGPHPMTCDTTLLHDRGVSFSLSEAEVVWTEVLEDAVADGLKSIYGASNRWSPVIMDREFRVPPRREIESHWVPMVGYYPVRGCPFVCSFCSVIKIAGRQVRNPSIQSIVRALKKIEKAGVEFVVFTSDNFNKFPEAENLLEAMVEEKIGIRFWFQADTQIVNQERLLHLIARAGGAEMFLGTESFDTNDLKSVQKRHNRPATYSEIVRMCRETGIRAHFSNIFGFPNQTERGIRDHVSILKELSPEFASFYILTPIPGTEQYKDYLDNGLIVETNLDRFDAHTPTVVHEFIRPEKLQNLLFESYEEFYKDAMIKHKGRIDRETRNYMVFCRLSAARRMHPMSSGLGAVEMDRNTDYLELRRKTFDVGELLPLPVNLELSAADQEINRKADWRVTS
jgi:radical SAM superfamily enzyme YgiQ (UPF0313 family)